MHSPSRTIFRPAVIFTLLLLTAAALLAQTNVTLENRIHHDLLAEMAASPTPEAMHRALLYLNERVNLRELNRSLESMQAGPRMRARVVIAALQEAAEANQRGLMRFLEGLPSTELASAEAYWLGNVIALEAKATVIEAVALRPEIRVITSDRLLEPYEPVTAAASQPVPGGAEPGLYAVNAHLMWQAGFSGAGTIVMNMDTGVNGTHVAFAARWLGNRVPAEQAWFDPWNGTVFPVDSDELFSHGTHTMGTITGLDTATSDTIGVAFGAEWMASNSLVGLPPHTSRSIASFQWAMDPDGDPETTGDMPIAINCSWWDPGLDEPGECDPEINPYIDVLAAVEAAGIAVVFACGNSGPDPQTVTRPSNVNVDPVMLFSVGATDPHDDDFPIAWFSSRGPVPEWCETGDFSLDTKPEVSAPGLNIRSSQFNSYGLLSGTSMAAPHVVGAIALLKQAHPQRTGHELKQTLYETALDLGSPGEDNTFGTGMIDVWAAHIALSDPNEPNTPEDVTAYSDYTTPESVLLGWTDPETYVGGDPLINFTIEIYRNGEFLASVESAIESHLDEGLVDGDHYEYELYAMDELDSLSYPVPAEAYAGGSPFPAPPSQLTCESSIADIFLSWQDPQTQVDGTPLDDLENLNVYRDGVWIATIEPGVETYTDSPPPGGSYSYTVTAVDDEQPPNESAPGNAAECFSGAPTEFLVWVGEDASGASAASGDSIFNAIVANGRSVCLTNDLFEFGTDLDIFAGIFVVLGVYDNNHFMAALDPEGPALDAYLFSGGRVYVEGGDCFNYDPEQGGYNIRPWFGLNDGLDGIPDISAVEGLNDLSAFQFPYIGDNSFMDDLEPQEGIPILQNEHLFPDIAGVYFDGYGQGVSIGFVPSFGGLVNNDAPLFSGVRRPEPGVQARESAERKPGQRSPRRPAIFRKRIAYPAEGFSKQTWTTRGRFDGGRLLITANTRTELMAAFIALFLPPGPPVLAEVSLDPPTGDGDFNYEAVYTNVTETDVSIDLWGEILDPEGNADPVFQTSDTIPPQQSISVAGHHEINSRSPAGMYVFTAAAGILPDSTIVSASTPFQKKLTGVAAEDTLLLIGVPGEVALFPNRPNPFNPGTRVRFQLPKPARVDARLYNIRGQHVATLADGVFQAGHHEIGWNGMDDAGTPSASGIYILYFRSGDYRRTLKLVLLR